MVDNVEKERVLLRSFKKDTFLEMLKSIEQSKKCQEEELGEVKETDEKMLLNRINQLNLSEQVFCFTDEIETIDEFISKSYIELDSLDLVFQVFHSKYGNKLFMNVDSFKKYFKKITEDDIK